MTHVFREVVIGGVLIAPIVLYAAAALLLVALINPLLSLVGFERAFSSPPVALLSIYVLVLAVLVILF